MSSSSLVPTGTPLKGGALNLFNEIGKLRFVDGQKPMDIYRAVFDVLKKSSSDGNVSKWLTEIFGYSGFDVLAFREYIKGKVHMGDVVYCIVTFLMRGNNIERIIGATSSAEAVTWLKSIKTTLGIKKNAAGKTNTVTLSRIAISFPDITAAILHASPELNCTVSNSTLETDLGIAEFPPLAKFTPIASMIPRQNKESANIMNVFFYANLCLSVIINQKNAVWNSSTPTARASSAHVYLLNALNSPIFSEEERVAWCEELDIMKNGKYTPVWTTAAPACVAELKKHYGMSF